MSSEYEQNVAKLLIEKNEKLQELKKNATSNKEAIERLETELQTL